MEQSNSITSYISTQLDLFQPADSHSSEEEQNLQIKTHFVENGSFVTINTERWAFDNREEWIAIWDDYIQKVLDGEKQVINSQAE